MCPKKTAGIGVSLQPIISGSNQLDFFSSEFNSLDDLDDNTGNCRTFQSLTGIVTSDMRHQEQRQKSISQPAAAVTGSSEKNCAVSKAGPKKSQAAEPPPLTLDSKGRLLIIDKDLERALGCAERLHELGIHSTLCSPADDCGGFSVSRIDSFAFIEAGSISISGSLGGFVPTVCGADGTLKNLSTLTGQLSSMTGQATGTFDLILDMQARPSFAGQRLPVGYYAPGKNSLLLEEALKELPLMRGRFKKPQFVIMIRDRCLHGRSHTQECHRCLDICPVAALGSKDRQIVIDQYRCEGCGACALICPSDAIQLPMSRRELVSELERTLSESFANLPAPPRVVFYEPGSDDARNARHAATDTYGNPILGVAVDEISLLGVDLLLATLAYGADGVALISNPKVPAAIEDALQRQVGLGRAIIRGLHMPADYLCFSSCLDDLPDLPWRGERRAGLSAGFTFNQEKRALTRLAAEHLCPDDGRVKPSIALPANSFFGTIFIDATCSLCMACVGACPADALVADGDSPRLSFIESRCHQCGLCQAACPENCITMHSRLLCDTRIANHPTVVYEAKPFLCIVCGQPFASANMVGRMQEKLAGHWMYSTSRQAKRLQMCRTCRIRDIFSAGD